MFLAYSRCSVASTGWKSYATLVNRLASKPERFTAGSHSPVAELAGQAAGDSLQSLGNLRDMQANSGSLPEVGSQAGCC